MRSAHRSSGFTLAEALGSVVLIAVGITAVVETLGKIERTETRGLETELMQRLAISKYHELISLNELTSGETSGDFVDVGEKRFTWQASRTPEGIGNLDSITVQVTRKGEDYGKGVEIEGLLCNPATKSSKGGNGQPGGQPGGNQTGGNPGGTQ